MFLAFGLSKVVELTTYNVTYFMAPQNVKMNCDNNFLDSIDYLLTM